MFVDIGILRVKAAKLLKLGLYMWMFDDVSKIGKAPCNHKENVLLSVLRSANGSVCYLGDLQRKEVWRRVTMVAIFLDHNNRELKQRRRRRQKSNRFVLA